MSRASVCIAVASSLALAGCQLLAPFGSTTADAPTGAEDSGSELDGSASDVALADAASDADPDAGVDLFVPDADPAADLRPPDLDPLLPGCRSKWCWENPRPFGSDLNVVWGISAGHVLVLGDRGAALRFDGSSWTALDPVVNVDLLAIWGTGTTVFASGAGGALLRYDGTAWNAMDTPVSVALRGIWGLSASDVHAVGGGANIVHYDGSVWATVAHSVSTQTLTGVWGAAPDDVVAVGPPHTVLRYNGSTWAGEDSNTGAWLQGLWGTAADNIFGCGGNGTIMRYDGTTWLKETTPTNEALAKVWGPDPSALFAFGWTNELLRREGTSWKIASHGPEDTMVLGIWGTSETELLAVGRPGSAFIVDPGKDQWSRVLPTHGVTDDLRALWRTPSGALLAVGERGTMLTRGPFGVWTPHPEPPPATVDFTAIWGFGATLFVGGATATLWRRGASGWEEISTPAAISALWGATPTALWATSPAGAVLRFDGTVCHVVHDHGTALNHLWGAGGRLTAVGDQGSILASADGFSWTAEDGATAEALFSSWGTAADDVYAGGDETLLHFDGTSWSAVVENHTNRHYHAIWGRSASDVFAARSHTYGYTSVLHFDGAIWENMPVPTYAPPRALLGAGDALWIAGDSGNVLIRALQ